MSDYSFLYPKSTKISLKLAGRYAVSEIYNGLLHAIKKSNHTLIDGNADINIMIRGIKMPPPPKPNMLILTDEPYETDKTCQFSHLYDLVFSNEHSTLNRHKNSVYLPLAYDPILKSSSIRKEYDLCHIGGGYPGRRNLVIPVIKRFQNSVLIGPQWPRIGKARKILVNFEEHIDYYRKSKIVLNIHRNNIYSAFGRLNRQGHPATHLAPRVWNCGAVGTFQIVDSNRDIGMVPSLVTATTAIEIIRKCEYYLANEKEREDLARKQSLEIRPHSWVERLGFILKTANEHGLIK